jgi:hypothetical protein
VSRSLIALVTALLVLYSATIAVAGPGRKVLVLPIDGDADPALRKQLGAVTVELARAGGEVSTGDTTFTETAAAIGCDPRAPACAETVRASLDVDELVYGSAVIERGQTTAVISRIARSEPRRDQTVAIAAGAKGDSAEPALRPLFGAPTAGSGSDGPEPPVAVGSGASPGDSFFATRERKLGFGFAGGGTLVVLIGLALWSSESSLQAQIDSAPTNSPSDIGALRVLEDRANHYAWEGNVAVVLGLAAVGVGAYFLLEDHRLRATVTPADHGTGAAVVLGGRW